MYFVLSVNTRTNSAKIVGHVENENLEVIFANRRVEMLKDKIDVSAFLTWFIRNYPVSKNIISADPDYQIKNIMVDQSKEQVSLDTD